MGNKRIDEPTGTEFVGHEWDGIEELNTPLPRWWLWSFYACVVWAFGYVVLYPALPGLQSATEGYFGWSSRGQLADEQARIESERAPLMAALAATPIEQLPNNPELMQQAVAGGRAAFQMHCVQCHGAGAAGSPGYPNLNDDDWLWGGNLTEIEQTLTHGIRQPGDSATRTSLMPAFGRDGMLDSAQITAVAQQVLSFSGQGQASAAGAEIYANNCAICHGADGTGLRQFGAPNLADAIWLYGSGVEQVRAQVTNPRHGVMPAWGERLDPATIRMLAAYVHSLGGGEDFVEVAAEPATASDATPLGETDEQP
ncbi:MAG: cytochrome-c oxidase, cbb3-type subunit III [Erythrobacter sp.]|nr:cytochrome-c oxidase, cbb3-type subunit III [Erythrobacter sp.]